MIEIQNCIHESANLELDAEVARFMLLPEVQTGHVAYWFHPTKSGWRAYSGPPDPNKSVTALDRACYVYRQRPETLTDSGLEEIPAYSRDIAAAWQVVEYVRSLMYWFCLYNQRETPDRWRASFCKVAIATIPVDGFGASVPEAICLAAVKIARIREATEHAVKFVQGHIE